MNRETTAKTIPKNVFHVLRGGASFPTESLFDGASISMLYSSRLPGYYSLGVAHSSD